MKVEISFGTKWIGRSDLDCVDPSMGVAAGSFQPTDEYVRDLHASAIDGVHQEHGADPFIIRSDVFGEIDCEGVVIDDFSRTLGEITVTVLGIGNPNYETYFAENSNYQAFKR